MFKYDFDLTKSMNKNLVGIIVIVILLVAIALILLWPTETPSTSNYQVSLTTNKMAYGIDETITVTVKNNLSTAIWFNTVAPDYCWPNLELLGKQNGDWARVLLLPMAPLPEGTCNTITNKLEPGDSVNLEYKPASWHDRNLMTFSSYKLGIGYTISEGAMETMPTYTNEFAISETLPWD